MWKVIIQLFDQEACVTARPKQTLNEEKRIWKLLQNVNEIKNKHFGRFAHAFLLMRFGRFADAFCVSEQCHFVESISNPDIGINYCELCIEKTQIKKRCRGWPIVLKKVSSMSMAVAQMAKLMLLKQRNYSSNPIPYFTFICCKMYWCLKSSNRGMWKRDTLKALLTRSCYYLNFRDESQGYLHPSNIKYRWIGWLKIFQPYLTPL